MKFIILEVEHECANKDFRNNIERLRKIRSLNIKNIKEKNRVNFINRHILDRRFN